MPTSLQNKMGPWIKKLQQFVDRLWYPPVMMICAALDSLIIVIPNDGILISSSMLKPRRWFIFGLSAAVGSTVGALVLSTLVASQGLPWILDNYPGISETKTWLWTAELFEKHGLLLVFAISVTPFIQQPVIILASLAETSFPELAAVLFSGRFVKFLVMAYIGSHAPKLLSRLWGIKGELKEVGVKLD